MKWKQLPIGQFIEAKRHAKAVSDIIIPLYDAPLPENAEELLPKAQAEWSAFLVLAAEEVDPAMADVATVTLAVLSECTHGFFLHQVGSAQK